MSDRRSTSDRRTTRRSRRSRSRRRLGNERFAVIEIARSDLRVVTLEQMPEEQLDRVRSATIPWRNEASSLHSEIGLEELTSALKEISVQLELSDAQVQIVLGGDFCITRAIQGSNEEVRSELQQLENRSRLYLMLGTGEKVTVSNLQQVDARHQSAVAAVCNRRTLDVIQQAAIRSGIEVDRIEPALISTSRVVGRIKDAPTEPCLLIHLEEGAAEIGICHSGRLLLDYRPGAHTELQELVEVVQTHLSRLQRHVARQLQGPPPKLKKVYLCGETNVVENAMPLFSACEQFEVERIDPENIQATWEIEGSATDSAMAPALGGLLSAYLSNSQHDAPDFMEHIVASTRMPLRPVLLRSAMPLVAVFLISLTILFENHRQQTSIDVLQHQIDELSIVQTRALELRLKSRSLEEKLAQIKVLSSGMIASPFAGIVSRVGHCMPNDVWLSRLSLEDMESLHLSGSSYLEAGVFDFVRWLELAPAFEDVALKGTKAGQSATGPVIDFNVELSLSDLDASVEEVARNE